MILQLITVDWQLISNNKCWHPVDVPVPTFFAAWNQRMSKEIKELYTFSQEKEACHTEETPIFQLPFFNVRLMVCRDKNKWKEPLKITFIALQYLEICLKENILMSVAFEWTKNNVTRDLIRSIKSTLGVQDDTTISILNQCFLCTLSHQAADTDVCDFTKSVRLERIVLFIVKVNGEVL